MDSSDLMKLKKEIEKAEREYNVLTGQLEQYYKQIKDEYGCGSLEELQGLLEKTQKEKEALEEEFNKAVELIEENYEI